MKFTPEQLKKLSKIMMKLSEKGNRNSAGFDVQKFLVELDGISRVYKPK